MRTNAFLAVAVVVVAVVGTFRLFHDEGARPVAADTSCHNPYQNGVRRVLPILLIDLRVDITSWSDVNRVLKEFAASEKWSIRDTSEDSPNVMKALELSLCTSGGLSVYTNEKRWASQNYADPTSLKLLIAMYGDVPEQTWHPVANRLVNFLETEWPDAVRFIDGNSVLIARPPFIAPTSRPRP